MRKVVYAINVSLDGCCDHTKMVPDERMFAYYIQLLREADLFVYGRKTYQLMVPYWPDVAKDQSASKTDRDFAEAFGAADKVVFSRTLDDAEAKKGDKKARVARTNLRDEILQLRQEAGKNILVSGVNVPAQLAELGLIDEYRLVVQPIVVGEGRRLLEGLQQRLQLKLAETRSFEAGCVALHYVKQ